MNHGRTMSGYLAFPLAAVISGFASGMSCIVPGGGIFFPGLLFGIAVLFAVHNAAESCHPAMATIVVLFSLVGYWIACITTLLSIRLFGGGNNIASDAMGQTLAGGVGASIIAIGLAISCRSFRSFNFVALTAAAGAVCGAVCGLLVYLHDNAHLPHPLDFILTYVIWQVGVASVMPFAKKKQLPGGKNGVVIQSGLLMK